MSRGPDALFSLSVVMEFPSWYRARLVKTQPFKNYRFVEHNHGCKADVAPWSSAWNSEGYGCGFGEGSRSVEDGDTIIDVGVKTR